MNYIMKLTGITFLVLLSMQTFSADVDKPDYFYGFGIGGSGYDTVEGESTAFSGTSIYFSWRLNKNPNRLTLRESYHGLQVVTPVNGKHVQRNWDVEYSWDAASRGNKQLNIYMAPVLGGKVKEKLTVKCRNQGEVCFDSYMSDWKITDTKQKILPVIGLNTGFRLMLYKSHIVTNTNLFLKTDLEDTYYGMEISLGFQQ